MADKVLYNGYNRGADIIRDDAHIKPSIDPVISDLYKETTSDDILAVREWDEMCQFVYDIYRNSDFYELDRTNPEKTKKIFGSLKLCTEELHTVYNYIRDLLLKEFPDTTEKEAMYVICESLQINYKKVWEYVLSPVQKEDILGTLNLKNKVNKSKLSSELF